MALYKNTRLLVHTFPGVTKALRNMNKRLNLPQLQKIMMQFERESEIMDIKEETISDTIDDVIGGDDEEEVRIGGRVKGGRGEGGEREGGRRKGGRGEGGRGGRQT